MRLEIHGDMYGRRLRAFPFDGRRTCVIAEHFEPTGRARQYIVSWPSIDPASIEDARQFAATINAACDWLEQKRKELGDA